MKTALRTLALACAAAVLACASGTATAQAWPTKTITIIVPFPAGGTTDLITRLIAQKLSEAFKVPVMIDNRGGAGGTLGATLAARAAPDGYTLLVGAVHHTIATTLYKKPDRSTVSRRTSHRSRCWPSCPTSWWSSSSVQARNIRS